MIVCASATLTKPVFVQALIPKLPIEALDVRVLDRLARADEAQLDAVRVRPRVERAPDKLRPVVDDDRAPAGRVAGRRSRTRTTRAPGSERSTSIATHSRVKSSTMLSVRKARPSASVSSHKVHRPALAARSAAGSGTRSPRVSVCVDGDGPASRPRDRRDGRACDSPRCLRGRPAYAAGDSRIGPARRRGPAAAPAAPVVDAPAPLIPPGRRAQADHPTRPPQAAGRASTSHPTATRFAMGPTTFLPPPPSAPECPASARRRSVSGAGSRPRAASAAASR